MRGGYIFCYAYIKSQIQAMARSSSRREEQGEQNGECDNNVSALMMVGVFGLVLAGVLYYYYREGNADNAGGAKQ